jgi:hypothetical protein
MSIDPSKPATKTSGIAMSTMVKEMPENDDTSSMYALKRRKEAKAADPIANPFVVAFVVFPTASSKSVISLTFSGCGHNDNAV